MDTSKLQFNRMELAGSIADLGIFLPLAIALITLNGVSASSIFLAAGLLYIGAGVYYKIPMPVQPLKATSVIAITMGASPQIIAATALCMGIVLLTVRLFKLNDLLRRLFPKAVIRGIQLSLGVILVKKGGALLFDKHFLSGGAEMMFDISGITIPVGLVVGIIAGFLLIALRKNRRFPASLTVLILGMALGAVFSAPKAVDQISLGYQFPELLLPSWSDIATALFVLLLPQLPLTFANSIFATEETAKQYFGKRAKKVTAHSLVTSLGLANIFAGLIGGIPVCHGSGGLTAHHSFGARSGGASVIIGAIFIFIALALGKSAPMLLNLLPLSVLSVMLIYIGAAHTLLVRDVLRSPWNLSVTLAMALITIVTGKLAIAFVAGVFVSLFVGVVSRYKTATQN